MLRRLALRSSLPALLGLALFAAPVMAAPAVSGEFKLATPIETNNKLATAANGDVWVTLQGPEKDVAKITPAGQVSEYELGVAGTSGVAVDRDGNVWVTRANGVNRLSPADPEGVNDPFEIAGIEGNSPIASGPAGNLWVATKDKVVLITLADPANETAFAFAGLSPTDIDATPTFLVVADAGTVKRILGVSTAGAEVGAFPVGGPPQGVAANPNGNVAFTQPVNEPKEMGLLAVTGPLFVRSIPGEDPFGITLGGDGAYWSPERNSDGMLRMTTTGEITRLTGFSAGAEPRQIAAGVNGTLWVTLPGAGVNSVGRVSGVEPPPAAVVPHQPPPTVVVPRTRIKGGPKGKLRTRKKFRPVRFGFDSPDAVTSFECRLRKLAPKGKGKARRRGAKGSAAARKKRELPKFKPCASPKGYKVKPGRYRFEVRAVNLGFRDRTPAKRGFRVVRIGR